MFNTVRAVIALDCRLRYQEIAFYVDQITGITYTASQIQEACQKRGITKKKVEYHAKEQDPVLRFDFRCLCLQLVRALLPRGDPGGACVGDAVD